MEMDVFMSYYKHITTIEAQNMLMQMQVSDYPNLKKQDRQRLYKQVRKQAYPQGDVGAKILTSEQVHNVLKGMMSG